MIQAFELKIIDDRFCVYDCPSDWIVNETGAVFHRVYYAYAGHAVYEGNNQSFRLQEGHIYVFPTNRPYKISHDPRNPFKCLWFHVVISPMILNAAICFNVQENPAPHHVLKAMEHIVESGEGLYLKKSLIEQLLHSLLFMISLKNEFLFLRDVWLNKVTQHIHEHYMENITNKQLSILSGYNTSYLIRLFKKTFGASPQKYILNYRLTKAIILIRENLPIWEVSSKVGYEDVKAFCRIFKKVKGVPPSEYRKSQYWQP